MTDCPSCGQRENRKDRHGACFYCGQKTVRDTVFRDLCLGASLGLGNYARALSGSDTPLTAESILLKRDVTQAQTDMDNEVRDWAASEVSTGKETPNRFGFLPHEAFVVANWLHLIASSVVAWIFYDAAPRDNEKLLAGLIFGLLAAASIAVYRWLRTADLS